MDQLSGFDRNADLLAIALLETDARRRSRLRIGDRHVRHVERRLLALDPALRAGLRRLAMARVDIHARHHDLHVFWDRANDFARLALVLARQDNDAVALADFSGSHLTAPPAQG